MRDKVHAAQPSTMSKSLWLHAAGNFPPALHGTVSNLMLPGAAGASVHFGRYTDAIITLVKTVSDIICKRSQTKKQL